MTNNVRLIFRSNSYLKGSDFCEEYTGFFLRIGIKDLTGYCFYVLEWLLVCIQCTRTTCICRRCILFCKFVVFNLRRSYLHSSIYTGFLFKLRTNLSDRRYAHMEKGIETDDEISNSDDRRYRGGIA